MKTLSEWIRHDAVSFSLDSSETFNAAVDKVIAWLGESVQVLGFGEALHGGEEILFWSLNPPPRAGGQER